MFFLLARATKVGSVSTFFSDRSTDFEIIQSEDGKRSRVRHNARNGQIGTKISNFDSSSWTGRRFVLIIFKMVEEHVGGVLSGSVTGKVYFVGIHLFLVLLGVYVIRKKASESAEEEDNRRRKALTGLKDNTAVNFDSKSTKKLEVNEQHDWYFNSVVKWCYLQEESSIKLLVECWMNNVENEVRTELWKRNLRDSVEEVL